METSETAPQQSFENAELRRWAASAAICFALFSAVMVVGSEWLLRTRVAPGDAAQRHYEFFAAASSPDAAFGDSQMAFGFSGAPGFVNLAHLGEPAQVILYKIKTYFASRDPGAVVLQANPSMFSAAYEDDDVDAMIARYQPGSRLLLLAPEYRGELATYWRMFLTGQPFEANIEFLSDGSRARDRRWADKPAVQRAALAAAAAESVQPTPVQDVARSRNFAAFREALAYLQSRGARLCLVDVPVSPELAAAIAEVPGYREAADVIARTAREFGARYLDLHDRFADPALFDDVNHLNPAGAERFTRELVQSCL